MNNTPKTRLIETDDFSFEFLSSLAERESWRKEIYRPVYHVHKWWAKRLGSVFRGITLGCLLSEKDSLPEAFYKRHSFSHTVVFDPFMGSGTTIGEAHKLGCISLGRDINPVACENVRIALGPMERNKLVSTFEQLSSTVGEYIKGLYKSEDDYGVLCDVLYYFWVMSADCPCCGDSVDLFSSRIIARNAYPNRKPEVKVCCPGCGDIFSALNTDQTATCPSCVATFNPHIGTASGAKAICRHCSHQFNIIETFRKHNTSPRHRLYGKLLLTPQGEKIYLKATHQDLVAYNACSSQLEDALRDGSIKLPSLKLEHGHNTQQAINYNYTEWRRFFNNRQLLALGILQEHIANITDIQVRDVMLNLFSSVLEFNNLFASYKGEGTGAVRHMFSHHILKPERMPIEANIWGTPKSSGSFVNMFRMRLLRALEYRLAPFEVTTNGSGKALSTSKPFTGVIEPVWPTAGDYADRAIYLSSGSSHATGLKSDSVDLVITDPPFFDNVHYSELADFFFSWDVLYPRGFIGSSNTTRQYDEVQDVDAGSFSTKLSAVFKECHRILKDDGLLVFTYHHSRHEGWTSLINALLKAGFLVVNAHPIKAEMSVATPKSQAKEPIQLDIILVCRKEASTIRRTLDLGENLEVAKSKTIAKLKRLLVTGIQLSRNDIRTTLISQVISLIDHDEGVNEAIKRMSSVEEIISDIQFMLHSAPALSNDAVPLTPLAHP